MKEILSLIKQQIYKDKNLKLEKLPAFLKVKELSPNEKAIGALGLVNVIANLAIEVKRKYPNKYHIDYKVVDVYDDILRYLLLPDTPFTENQLLQLLKMFRTKVNIYNMYDTFIDWPIPRLVDCIWEYVKKNGLSENMRAQLLEVKETPEFSKEFYRTDWGSEELCEDCKEVLDRILVSEGDESVIMPFKWKQDDAIGKHLTCLFKQMTVEEKERYFALFHVLKSKASKPNKKFLESVKPLLEQISESKFSSFMKSVVKHLKDEEITEVYVVKIHNATGTPMNGWKKVFLHKKTEILIKCLIWCCNPKDDTEFISDLSSLVANALDNKTPQLATASIYSLSNSDCGQTELQKLVKKIKHPKSVKLIKSLI